MAVDGWAVTFGTASRGLGRSPPRAILAVPNVTAHPLMASVPASGDLLQFLQGFLQCVLNSARRVRDGICRCHTHCMTNVIHCGFLIVT